MDVWITFNNGSIVPLTGVTGVASIDSSGTPSADDIKLLTVDSGYYRDTWNYSALPFLAGSVDNATTQNTSIFVIPPNASASQVTASGVPPADPVPAACVAGVITGQSDEIAHEGLRQVTFYESLWEFSLTFNSENLKVYAPKSKVLSWGNVEPTV